MALHVAWRGVVETPFLPPFILFVTFLGFGALASQTGMTPFQATFSSFFMFAIPGQIVLAEQMARGASILTTALAVAATGVRFLPMTVSLMAVVRHPRLPKWVEFVIAHFVAMTMWVEAMHRVARVPRNLRAPYTLGLSAYLVLASCQGALAGFLLAERTPPVITAALLFLSPAYFLITMLGAARDAESMTPILTGVVLGPVLYLWVPDFDVALTGLVGGTFAFLVARRRPVPRLAKPTGTPPKRTANPVPARQKEAETV